MSCKIFFSDLDGTLLNSQKVVTPATKEAVFEWMNAGNIFVLSSGRPLLSILEVVQKNGLAHPNLYTIAFNGGLIYHPASSRKLQEKTLSLETVKSIAAIAREHAVYCHTYDDTTILIPKKAEEITYYTKSIHLPYKVLNTFPDDIVQRPCKVLCIDLSNSGRLDELSHAILRDLSDTVSCVLSNAFLLEVFPKDSGKGAAVSELCKFLRIAHNDTFASGDEQNDESMLTSVAHGIAMCNGNPSLFDKVEYVTTLGCDNDGLVPFLTKFLSQ